MIYKQYQRCTICKQIKHFKEFRVQITARKDLTPVCRICSIIRQNLSSAKQRAKEKNIPFNLNHSDIKIPEYCPVLGIKLEHNSKTSDNSPSIDRIDNSKGYTKDNIIVVSHKANRIKNDATVEELGKVYEFYKELCQDVAFNKKL